MKIDYEKGRSWWTEAKSKNAIFAQKIKLKPTLYKGTFINDVPRFFAISDLPTYLVLLYNVPFLGLSWTPLPTLIRDVINERTQKQIGLFIFLE